MRSDQEYSIPTPPIAARTRTCLESFDAVHNSITNSGPTSIGDDERDAILDCHSRFRLWAGNIGAYQVDARSIDHRLKDAPEVTQRVLELLEEIIEGTEEIHAIVSGQREDAAAVLVETEDLASGEEDSTELLEICLASGDAITSLLKISGLLRKATGRDRFAKAAAAARDDAFPALFDVMHVEAKFPKVKESPGLSDRLGTANVQRRQYLRYARDHHERLAHDKILRAEAQVTTAPLETTLRDLRRDQGPKTLHSRPTLAPTKASTLDMNLMPANAIQKIEAYDLDDAVSQTTTVFTSAADDGDANLDVIKLSEVCKDGQPFECPYCRTVVQTKSQRSWR